MFYHGDQYVGAKQLQAQLKEIKFIDGLMKWMVLNYLGRGLCLYTPSIGEKECTMFDRQNDVWACMLFNDLCYYDVIVV